MNEIKISLSNKNHKKEMFKFLNTMSNSLKNESIINVTMVNNELIIPNDIQEIFSGHSILWFLHKGINFESDFAASFSLKESLPVSLVITAGAYNYMIIQNNLITGIIGDKDCSSRAYNIAKSILRLST